MPDRLEREARIPQSLVDLVAASLTNDLVATLGDRREEDVQEAVVRLRVFADESDFEQCVLDDVQQWMHDAFIDTSWPRCPDHSHHPLWYEDGWWTCQQTGKQVAPLGGLGAIPRSRHTG
jgi:hypothetical protein